AKTNLIAAQMAVDEINASGGIAGKKLRIVNFDTAGQRPARPLRRSRRAPRGMVSLERAARSAASLRESRAGGALSHARR
ncbi:MAG: hypothetical protein ACRENE_31785, partial [Polyangiaceae bacterium]